MPGDADRLCACGCGERTRIATRTVKSRGLVRGRPLHFIHGHNRRAASRPEALYRIDDLTGCWLWVGRINRWGYGVFGDELAHRLFYRRSLGEIPVGAQVDHRCHDPSRCREGRECQHRRCVNPAHLQLVSPALNTRRGGTAKLTPEAVREIRESPLTARELADRFSVRVATIADVRNRRTWRD